MEQMGERNKEDREMEYRLKRRLRDCVARVGGVCVREKESQT